MSEFTLPPALRSVSPVVGLVLGSGLGGFVDSLSDASSWGYAEIPGLPVSSVPGHAGKLHVGRIGGVEIAIAQGRVHLYELGISTVVLTNAAGIVNANLKPGRWMLLSDHLNLARQSPLTGSARFIDQTEVYSADLRELLRAESLELNGNRLPEGVYAWVNGPEYETPAEVRLLRTLGADAVGMSTVPEAIQARALGMRVVALSCLTNYGAGLSSHPLNHEEVIAVGQSAAKELFAILESAIPAMVEI
jgi:purine-nucleoside phosphorylase